MELRWSPGAARPLQPIFSGPPRTLREARRTVRPMDTFTPTEDLASEHADPHCLTAPDLAALIAPAPWRRLAVVGDSIAAGVGDPARGYRDLSWADRLAEVVRLAAGAADPDPAYLNLGVRALMAKEIRESQLGPALAFAPDLAVVTAGGNDTLRRSFDPAAVEVEIEGIVGPLAAAGGLVVTFGLLDLSRTSFVPDGMRAGLRSRLVRLNAVTHAVTARHGGVFVDFFDHPALDDELFSDDMIHPNRRGHAHIATTVVRALAARVGHQSAGVVHRVT